MIRVCTGLPVLHPGYRRLPDSPPTHVMPLPLTNRSLSAALLLLLLLARLPMNVRSNSLAGSPRHLDTESIREESRACADFTAVMLKSNVEALP